MMDAAFKTTTSCVEPANMRKCSNFHSWIIVRMSQWSVKVSCTRDTGVECLVYRYGHAGGRTIVSRNIQLAQLTGSHIHCQHMSSAGAVQLIREAKDKGIPFLVKHAPHHFTLTDAAIAGSESFWEESGADWLNRSISTTNDLSGPPYDTLFKMNPPSALSGRPSCCAGGRCRRDIGSPGFGPCVFHCSYEKEVNLTWPPLNHGAGKRTGPGADPASPHRPHDPHGVDSTLDDPSCSPDAPQGRVFECGWNQPTRPYSIRKKRGFMTAWTLRAKLHNSPFHGWPMKGRNRYTILDGKVVYQAH